MCFVAISTQYTPILLGETSQKEYTWYNGYPGIFITHLEEGKFVKWNITDPLAIKIII